MAKVKLHFPEQLAERYSTFLYGLIKVLHDESVSEIKRRMRVKDESYVGFVLSALDKKQFSSKVIEKEVTDYFISLRDNQMKKLIRHGIPKRVDSVLDELIQAFIDGNIELIASVLTEYRKNVAYVIGRAYTEGLGVPAIVKELKVYIDQSKTRVETIAISETARLSSKINRDALKENGITVAIWSSARDRRVRKCHKAREGVRYDLDKGCYVGCDARTIQVGEEVRCRCAMLIVV